MRRTRTSTLKVSGPFSLAAALDALDAMLPRCGNDGAYEGWHVIGGRSFNVRVRQVAPSRLLLSVDGDHVGRADFESAEALVRRMFGLDLDAERFYTEAAAGDRVLRRLQARLTGVRPVTAATPVAALVWTLIADQYGPDRARVVLCRLRGAETAGDLARLDAAADAARLGVEPATVERLRRLGERGVSGAFGVELLRSMPVDAARSWICRYAEVGVATADTVLSAGVGRDDVVPAHSPQLIAAVERYYGVARDEARHVIADMSRRWGRFAHWAAYLLVEAARRDVSARATT